MKVNDRSLFEVVHTLEDIEVADGIPDEVLFAINDLLTESNFGKIEAYSPLPSGVLGAFNKKYRLVLNTPKFFYNSLKTLLATGVLTTSGGLSIISAIAATAVLDALHGIKSTASRLKENAGELCTFSVIHDLSGTIWTSLKRESVNTKDVWAAHQVFQSSCDLTSCRFHEDGCKFQHSDFRDVIERFEDRDIINIDRERDTVSPKL